MWSVGDETRTTCGIRYMDYDCIGWAGLGSYMAFAADIASDDFLEDSSSYIGTK